MFFALFGNNAMYQYLTGRFDFLAVTASQGENAAIVGALMHLTDVGPLALLILVLFVFVGFIYSATTVNASAYAIATVASKNMDEGTDVEPHVFNRVIWAVFLGAIALALMYQEEVVTQSAAVTARGRRSGCGINRAGDDIGADGAQGVVARRRDPTDGLRPDFHPLVSEVDQGRRAAPGIIAAGVKSPMNHEAA